MTVRANPEDSGTLRTVIDRRLHSWIDDAPSQLAADAARPFDVVDDRFRGRFLVLGAHALPGPVDSETAIDAGASVELLFGQAWLNARAAGFVDDYPDSVDRSRLLLASDYLHSLAYAGLGRVCDDPHSGRTWYRTLEQASERLARCWVRSIEVIDDGDERVPIEPVVTATAGRLATLIGGAEEYREALHATGTMLGIARWQSKSDSTPSRLPSSFTDTIPDSESLKDIDGKTITELLAPLPESKDATALRTLAQSVLETDGRCPRNE